MAGKRTRRRRGSPRGKAYGFHGVRPASRSSSHSGSQSSATSKSTEASEDTKTAGG